MKTSREFYIPQSGAQLFAKLDMPAQEAGTAYAANTADTAASADGEQLRCPLMLLIHGLTGDMEEAHLLAVTEKMNELGAAVLRVELYGHGRSGGEYRDHTLFNWIEGILAAMDYVKTLDFVTDLILCGHSQGGLAVMYGAAIRQEAVRGMILLAPAWSIPDEVRAGNLFDEAFDPENIPEEVSCRGGEFPMSREYLRVARLLHPEEAISYYHGPVLIVQGTDDDTILTDYSRRAADMYENAEYAEIEGDTHCYDYHPEVMTAAVERFVRRVFHKPA